MSETERTRRRLVIAPVGTRLTYGLIGVSLAVLGLMAFAGFYDVSLWRHGLAIIGVLALAFLAGLVLHRRRRAQFRDGAP